MKNTKLCVLAVAAILALVACGPTSNPTTDPTSDPTTSTTSDPTTDPTSDPTTATTSDPTTTVDDPSSDPTTGPHIDPKFKKINEYLYATYLPGQYDEKISLELYAPAGYKIYYSLDCEEPTTEYKEPIVLDELPTTSKSQLPLSTSVDGILADAGDDKCSSGWYIDNIQIKGDYLLHDRINVVTVKVVSVADPNDVVVDRALSYMIDDYDYTIPIISLSMPYEKWFGEKEGFYNKIREEIEHRCNLEYWDAKYEEYFFRNTQIKLGGNWTLGYPMRTLNLNFNKDQYGEKNDKVTEHVFEERQKRDESGRVTKINRFRLWSGGNSFESWTGYNDAIIQQIMESDSYSATAGWRPCITYCNGEYWGMYYIREHYKDVYFEVNYGVEKDDVLFAELKGNWQVDDGDEDLCEQEINKFVDFYTTYDFSSDVNYATFVSKYIDVDSFIDAILACYYSSNWDFIGNNNNLKMWKVVREDEENEYTDGKWRFVLHDIDFAFSENKDYLDNRETHAYQKHFLLKNLLRNEKFRTKMYNRAEELMETNFSYEYAEGVVKGMMNKVKPYKKDAMRRWGNLSSNAYIDWINENQRVLNYIKDKETTFLPMLYGHLFEE